MSRARDVAGAFLWASLGTARGDLAGFLARLHGVHRDLFLRGEEAGSGRGRLLESLQKHSGVGSLPPPVDSWAGELSCQRPWSPLLGAGGTPLPSCGNQRRLQTWPSVPSLTKLSQAESHCPRLYFPITTIKNYRKLSSLKKTTDFFSYGSGGLKFKGQGVGRALFLLEAPGKTRVLVVPGCRRLQRPESSGLPTWHLRTIPCGRGFRCHFSPLVPPAPCSLGPWRLP